MSRDYIIIISISNEVLEQVISDRNAPRLNKMSKCYTHSLLAYGGRTHRPDLAKVCPT